MLDENLPTFGLKASSTAPKHDSTFYYTQHGSDPQAVYTLRRPNPDLPGCNNRYAAALYDSHNPDVLFAEVLLIPDWKQPSLSAEAVRLNGGVAPPPEPVLPGEFVVQLYNPDQQVRVTQKPRSWSSAPSWEFEMPQQSFRQPSNSSLDKTQDDPAASELTPRIGFRWKRDSKFTKDLACFHVGNTFDADGNKRRDKEPDITVAIFRALKEVTLYEPNLQRFEIEDLKGFEVVLLLSAAVIRDVYFGQLEQAFNISDPPGASSGLTSSQTPTADLGLYGRRSTSPQLRKRDSYPARPTILISQTDSRLPLADPRTQGKLDADTAKLKEQVEAKERQRRRKEDAEKRRIEKMLKVEEKERRRKQAEVDQETERLKKIYGDQGQFSLKPPARPLPVQHQYSDTPPQRPDPFWRPQSIQPGRPQLGSVAPAPGPGLHDTGKSPSQSGFFGNSGLGEQKQLREKKSFFGFRFERPPAKLHKKQSSMF